MTLRINTLDGANVWFTSDQHFGHKNIIEYCHRPFPCVESMDDIMVYLWNDCVQPNDVVFQLGDITLANADVAKHLFSQLNGHIYVVPGNHDNKWLRGLGVNATLSLSGHPVTILPKVDSVVVDGTTRFELCHYPVIDWNMRLLGTIHLHGHSHLTDYGVRYMHNVGVDLRAYAPVDWKLLRDM